MSQCERCGREGDFIEVRKFNLPNRQDKILCITCYKDIIKTGENYYQIQPQNPQKPQNLCPGCKNPIEENTKICPYCGKKLPENSTISHQPYKEKCQDCGKSLSPAFKFCPYCGKTIEKINKKEKKANKKTNSKI